MTIADLVIKLTADTSSAAKGLSSFGAKAGNGIRKMAIPAAAALGVLGVAAKLAYGNLRDGAQNAKQTEAVLRSTGGAANVTAKHVDALAMSLRRKAGVDDDVVHSGENMLLTFTNIRNEVGRGNDIFDQATKAMLDMSHALGQDTKSSAIQLGKALNDPIKGVTALQRVGVSFTADQRKQIKSLVESGHAMDAQKLILHELNKEFGGSAEHIDPFQKNLANAKLDLTDFASGILAAAMPALTAFVGIIDRATSFLTKHQEAAKYVVGAIAAMAAAILVLNGVMAIFALGIAGPIVIGLVALAAGLIYAYQHCETFRNIVQEAFRIIQAVAQAVIGWLVANVPAAWATIQADTVAVWNAIVAVVTAVWGRIRGIVMTEIAAVKGIVSGGLQELKGVIDVVMGLIHGDWGRVWKGIKEIVSGALTAIVALIRGSIGVAQQAARALGDAILDGIVAIVKTIASHVLSALGNLWGALKGLVGRALSAGAEIGRAIMEGIANGIKSALGGALSAIENAGSSILSHAKGFLHINSPSLLFAKEIGGPIMEGIAKGMSDNSGMMLGPFKAAKYAVDDWANTKGVANMEGVGGSLAGAIGRGFAGGLSGPSGPVAGAIANSTYGNVGLDAPFVAAMAGGQYEGIGGGNGDVYLDGQKVGKVLRSNLYGVKRRTGGLQFES